MQNKTIVLPVEMWERLIEILDAQYNGHPDTPLILYKINQQLYFNPSDKQTDFVADKDNPNRMKRT